MVSITEAAGQQSGLQAALNQGLQSIDHDQTVTFTQYTKTILPADGYVFWVQTGTTTTVNGSIHYAIEKQQNEDETIAINRVIFSSEDEIQVFDSVSPTTIFIGTFDGLQFAFSSQGRFYAQAGVWHYQGDAVYPALSSQLVTSSAGLAALEPIVSNSLPIWLGLTAYGTVYPSFLVEDNIAPPYIVAHIGEEDTEALAPIALSVIDNSTPARFVEVSSGVYLTNQTGNQIAVAARYNQTSSQLMRDRVRFTLYGFTNQQAVSFRDYLFQYSMNTDAFGVCGIEPVIRDAKRTQREIGVIAQKKTFTMDVSYYQSAVSSVAQSLILSASITFST